MKFRTLLSEAILIKRSLRFLVDVELVSKRRRTLYCPNLGPLPNFDMPGTKLWFRSANRLSQGYLDILELIEVNSSKWTAVNPEYAQVLVRESLHCGTLPELQGYRFLYLNNALTKTNPIELLVRENGEQCYIHIKPIFNANEQGGSYFPEIPAEDTSPLLELIRQRENGHRAILFYCVQHTGGRCVRPADLVHPIYTTTLRSAVSLGVEVLAYSANINLREITLGTRIPVLLSEDITSR